eukprot:CAMPEP_0116149818 /NCGR_PEP_ID=MMETSP0329-20121206/19184_1 /TAXON_ID=697910 /ORGANISM="Pseudo-nitzschia arenysensis, Strain B593" /LENGTH=1473 /DNA_ID=CAMNT_0003646225 /DNA_START=439 /DNA_END=4860 /DNA_ORIENTATION=-
MEERSNNVVVDTAAAPVVPNRRTAAIDVLTRALLSPPIQEKKEDNEGPEAAATRANAKAIADAASSARSFLDTTCSVYVLDADTSGNSMIGPNSPTTSITNTSPTQALGSSNNNSNNSGDISGNDNMPKIFGCWNFLHQAMNEIERFEDEQNHMAAGATNRPSQPALLAETRLLAEFAVKVSRRSDELDQQKVATCVENFCGSSTARSASSASLSSAGGKENASNDSTSDTAIDSQAKGHLDANKSEGTPAGSNHDIRVLLPHLVRSNAEIREIVTGRIAAFSFNGGQPTSPLSAGTTPTAFADPQVVETFCRFLAANAVSNGAERLGRFLNDWIIPAATVDLAVDGGKRQRLEGGNKRLLTHRLPPFSLACVLYHIAAEAETISEDSSDARTISPLGTIDVLQKLSILVIANVLLGPVLFDALKQKQLKRQLKQHRQQLQQPAVEEEEDMDDRTIAMGLRAILRWCKTTDLSLAQCKHIGSKVQLNLSQLLGEALQTECPSVMSALADLIEDVVERHVVPQTPQTKRLISDSRMTQTRYLMQVPDEASFRANVSEEQLHTIETKELTDILSELSEDVERQRFRFPSFGMEVAKGKESPAKKSLHGEVPLDDAMHSLGHSLSRIAAALCLGYAKVVHPENSATAVTPGPYRIPPGSGMMELLSKCASHPSVSICGIVLPVITPVLKTKAHLATQWLPTLQRRAIIPHHPNNVAILSPSSHSETDTSDKSYVPLLAASDICFVEFEEFIDRFRETVLADALNACYSIHSEYYLASCTAAIEEFCVGDVVTEQTSFHLEAALFCLAVVAEQVLSGLLPESPGARATSPNPGSKLNANIPSYLLRCTAALAKKPKSLNNSLTMVQACRFMRNYAEWFGSNQHPGILDISADLTLHILVQCATSFSETPLSSTIYKETGISPYSDAAKTLRSLLCNNAKHFLSNKAIAALGAGWEATLAACNRGGKLLTLDDRKETCIGICHVLAALPTDQQQTSLMALALASIACLEAMVERADSSGGDQKKLSPILDRAADEIVILVTTARAFTEAISARNPGNESGRTAFVEPSMMVLGRAWPKISIVASKYSFHDSILESLRFLFVECTAASYKNEMSLTFLQKICALAQTVISNETARQKNDRFFLPVLDFLEGFVEIHGATFDTIVLTKQSSETESVTNPMDKTMFQCLDSLARETIQAMTSLNLLGSAWTSDQTQGNGQSAQESKYKRPLPRKRTKISSSGLAPFFSFLQTCTTHCPAFLLHILAFEGHDSHDDENSNDAPDLLMLRKVLGSAVSSIIDVEAEISVRSMVFLESFVSLAATATDSDETNNTAIRRVAGEYNLQFQTNMLSTLLRGICGMLQPFVIPNACHLLFHALSKTSLTEEEFKVIVLRGLSQDHFFLGNRARNIVYENCFKLLRNSNANATNTGTAPSFEKFQNMMIGMWRLHRFEDVDMIERSDAVHAFCIQHGSKKLQVASGTP